MDIGEKFISLTPIIQDGTTLRLVGLTNEGHLYYCNARGIAVRADEVEGAAKKTRWRRVHLNGIPA